MVIVEDSRNNNTDTFFDLASMTYDDVMATNVCVCLGEIMTKDYSSTYAAYNFAVVIVLIPLIALFGIVTNCINIYVFTRNRMTRESTNIYLLFLACSDLLVVIGGLFIFCLDSLRSYVSTITVLATNSALWVMPLGYAAQTCSVYCTVGAAANCYTKFCHPLSSATRRFCKPKTSRLMAGLIAFFSAAYNSLRFWLFYLHQCNYYDTPTVELCPSRLYFKIYITYTIYMYTLLMVFVPFLALTVLNALILSRLRSKTDRLEISKTDRLEVVDSIDRTIDRHCITAGGSDIPNVKPLVMVVVLFLSCNFLALVSNIVEAFFEPDALTINFLNDTSNLLVVLNSSVNFVIYLKYDPDYRKSLSEGGVKRTRSKPNKAGRNLLSLVQNRGLLSTTTHHQHSGSDSWNYFSLNGTVYNCYGSRLSIQTYVTMPKDSVDFAASVCFRDNQMISPESDL